MIYRKKTAQLPHRKCQPEEEEVPISIHDMSETFRGRLELKRQTDRKKGTATGCGKEVVRIRIKFSRKFPVEYSLVYLIIIGNSVELSKTNSE